jgi:magnesium chelatase subunit I
MMFSYTLNAEQAHAITTLGQLKAIGYQPRTIREEVRQNLIKRLENGQTVFKNVLGYDDTVIPELQTALLARHNILLLGLRGQAKTRIARQMTDLLDEWIPVLANSELNEDPFHPITRAGALLVTEMGDQTPIRWLHRSERYSEKLATPDVTVADLIGDLDPIKAANLKLAYSDERVIHFGIIPRSNRCIFVINELPDLQARIQVALFNILQEKDIQIRGFKLRLLLDIIFVFTANPEDYTNRGSIVTPLKDRIESQILTHYPKTIEISKEITQQEARIIPDQHRRVTVLPLLAELIEQIAFSARKSEFIDQKSGVSARLTIAAYESLVSAAERRAILNREPHTFARIGDLYHVIPAITGKIELVYEGEQEGPLKVAMSLISLAIREQFIKYFPDPEKLKRNKQAAATGSPFQTIQDWFANGKKVDLLSLASNSEYTKILRSIGGLKELIRQSIPGLNTEAEELLFMEFALHGMADYSLLNKARLEKGVSFKDVLGNLLGSL